ncbi:CBS domain-containing protein [Allostreptomyces psammosilenae]|uniref:CBS domain-containing protein n=1 Tax=Allostreptomyces psammosilenae TaxID=1892865 RepID=A0A852ZPU3_9ACTN|nr:CBS domain-containing protein [Allostreptomyces psammosilenae]NYI04389.1 CBS domain-containing protein [Allostreptomyces psammosilenae]
MTTARDIMHPGATCIGIDQNLQEAARMMRDLEVGALPICGNDNQLKGIITDRDIVITCCAEGRDPASVTARDFRSRLYWIDAGADVSEVLRTMEQHQVRRLPVIENQQLVGMISEAEIARNLSKDQIAEFTGRVYATA